MQHFAEAFWRRWISDYLPSLLPWKKWLTNDLAIKVGDVVLIIDEQAPRNIWRKGVVGQTFPGNDGEIRVVEIKTANGFLKRPSRKLIKFAEVQNT